MNLYIIICHAILCGLSFWGLHLLNNYRKLFYEQHKNVIILSEVLNKYKELYEKEKEKNDN